MSGMTINLKNYDSLEMSTPTCILINIVIATKIFPAPINSMLRNDNMNNANFCLVSIDFISSNVYENVSNQQIHNHFRDIFNAPAIGNNTAVRPLS